LYSSNNQNPFSSFMKDMTSSLMGNSLPLQPQVDQILASVETLSSWDHVRLTLESKMTTDNERLFRANIDKGYGVASPLHRVRLFDASNREEDIRVVFYRDSASWCPYCQKVWLTLEEKRIPYRVEKVNMRCYGDKPASFMRMQPSGQIPVAVIDGKVYGQSNDILYVLEESFPEYKSLKPPKGTEPKAQELLRLERQLFSAWMYWLTSSGGARLRQEFVQVLQQVERELQSTGPFFMGKQVTTVDFMYASFLERMAASLLYYKGFVMRVAPGQATDYPAVNRWFDAMETLESYQLTKSDYYTHCWDLPPQLGGCVAEPAGDIYRRTIDGERLPDDSRGSWELPLEPHNGGVEPDWTWAGDEAWARREAVERLSANYNAIVRFAARGAGRKGMPPVSAPLADPNAVPSEAVIGSVDAILRIVCMALLDGTEQHSAALMQTANIIHQGGKELQNGVVDSLAYLRDRVGVPRDMKLPAARQLRAYLNWAIEKVLDA
jgi:glutathione S-transferase